MADMDVCEFASMIEETTVKSRIIEYHDPTLGEDSLVASCLTDIMGDGMSMVYSFFHPDQARRSLGLFMILDHIAIAREAGLPHIYLGYWVPGSRKMDYKAKFAPFEYFRSGVWTRIDDASELNVEELIQPDPAPTLP
jgi:arginine-tRNA-protein transferase